MADSYLKAPYYRPIGYPEGSTGWAARPAQRGRPLRHAGGDRELEEYRQRLGRIVQSGFHYHYARSSEATYASSA